jgi:cyanate permease
LAQASGPLIAGFLRDWTNDYNTSLSLFTIFAIIAAGLVFFARPPATVAGSVG